ncbi:MAG: AraC family transcriptional regulator [Oscillibacter sp.]|nr:AraC family transcriptional regulator [Oscillibacter sp.]
MNHAIELYSACFFEYDGTQRTVPHVHNEVYQLYYVESGSLIYLYDKERINLTKGQFLLVVPGVEHGMITQGPSNVLDIKFGIFDSLLRASVTKKLAGFQRATPEAVHIFASIVALQTANSTYFHRISSLYLETIFYLMLQDIALAPSYLRDDPGIQGNFQHLSSCVRRALPFVEGSLVYPVAPFSPESIANQVGYNTRYISSKFSEEIGISLTKYFRILRINKAKDLLYNTDLKITVISKLLNYEDVSQFIKHFKKSTGMSPNEYRNYHRNAPT